MSGEIEPVYHVTDDGRRVILKRLKHDPDVLDGVAPDLFTTDFGTVRFIRDDRHQLSGMLLSGDRVYKLRFRRQARPVTQ